MMRSPDGGYALVCTPCLRYPVYYWCDKDTVRYWIGMIVPYRSYAHPTHRGNDLINATGINREQEDYGVNVYMYLQWGVQREPRYALPGVCSFLSFEFKRVYVSYQKGAMFINCQCSCRIVKMIKVLGDLMRTITELYQAAMYYYILFMVVMLLSSYSLF